MSMSFTELNNCFRTNNFPRIENDNRGIRFLKLRSMSRKATMEEFCELHHIDIQNLNSKNYFPHIFDLENIKNEQIDNFINSKYQEERQVRIENQDYLVDQMNRLQHFDWGGSFGNSLEKNIVPKFCK
ncbi:MAG: hypothetical protein KAI83_18295 [Thiomargarita sp.]|nr:hypothetical protein [Thiomargarita sp.]